jgi:spoIIIJ-associated protein
VEWVETTGRTLEDAKDAALDQLGVDEQDAEFEIVDEPKSGLFGLTRREARVRARVRPTAPRPKVDRRDRRRKGGARSGRNGANRRGRNDAPASSSVAGDGAAPVASSTTSATTRSDADGRRSGRDARPPKSRRSDAATASSNPTSPDASPDAPSPTKDAPMSNDDVSVDEQATIIREFVEGLLDAYGLEGELSSTKVDEDTIEIQVTGSELGLLIGPKGQTLAAIQDLSRTVVQRQASGTHHGRVRLDVSGYRQRRREALERFARSVADDVKASGLQKALEPMNPADRKIVHDTVNEIGGVSTISEGEDQRRRVVIVPDA